jgi:hypothetical protein
MNSIHIGILNSLESFLTWQKVATMLLLLHIAFLPCNLPDLESHDHGSKSKEVLNQTIE